MRCDEFSQRFQETLDNRQSPWSDPQLQSHAEQCVQCADWIGIWEQVENHLCEEKIQVFPPKTSRPIPHISLQPKPLVVPQGFRARCQALVASLPKSSWIGIAMAAGLLFVMLIPETTPNPQLSPLTVRSPESHSPRTSGAPFANPPLGTPTLLHHGGLQFDLHEISERVTTPDWWGAMMVAAWSPLDPLTKGIRPITESLESALRLLDPRAHLQQRKLDVQASEDISAGKPELLAQVV